MGFSIEVKRFFWVRDDGMDDPQDKCLHGEATVHIGGQTITDTATLSAAAMFMLRTLTEDRVAGKNENHMLPCCGHFLVPDEKTGRVLITGCCYGHDWTVRHEGGEVVLITEDGAEERVPQEAYRTEVLRFADSVEAYYKACAPKEFTDDFVRDCFELMWSEWRERRYGIKARYEGGEVVLAAPDGAEERMTVEDYRTNVLRFGAASVDKISFAEDAEEYFSDYDAFLEGEISIVSASGVVLRDGRKISFADCARTFAHYHRGGAKGCVGEWYEADMSFMLYALPKPVMVKFADDARRRAALAGDSARERARTLERMLAQGGFCVCDGDLGGGK